MVENGRGRATATAIASKGYSGEKENGNVEV